MTPQPRSGNQRIDIHQAIELHRSGRLVEATAAYQKLLIQFPQDPQLLIGFGTLLLQTGDFEKGLELIDRVLGAFPDHPIALSNRGNALRALNRPAEALLCYDHATASKPDYAGAYYNRGALLHELRRFGEALRDYDRAIALSPDLVDAYWNKSLLSLITGNYEEGWRLYEWRWKGPQRDAVRTFGQPVWLGHEPVQGKKLLLHAEAGLGDTIQFCRYAPLVAELGAEVLIEVPSPLLSLVSTLKGNFTFIRRGDALPGFDMHCPMMSLPLALRTTVETIPSSVPYLYADAGRVARWWQQLGEKTKARVGLVWSGSSSYKNDRDRSLPLRLLESLLHLPIELHALQKEIKPDDLAALASFRRVNVHQEQLADFSDTAAIVEAMDLVISVDTSVAHLAGAMGKKVWILLSYSPDHRWFLDRSDSPWYPTARLFRQSGAGDWSSVISELTQRLASSAAQ